MNSNPSEPVAHELPDAIGEAFASIYSVAQTVMNDAMEVGSGFLEMRRVNGVVTYHRVDPRRVYIRAVP